MKELEKPPVSEGALVEESDGWKWVEKKQQSPPVRFAQHHRGPMFQILFLTGRYLRTGDEITVTINLLGIQPIRLRVHTPEPRIDHSYLFDTLKDAKSWGQIVAACLHDDGKEGYNRLLIDRNVKDILYQPYGGDIIDEL